MGEDNKKWDEQRNKNKKNDTWYTSSLWLGSVVQPNRIFIFMGFRIFLGLQLPCMTTDSFISRDDVRT